MTLQEYMRALSHRWKTVVVMVVVGVACAIGYTKVVPSTYVATAQLFVHVDTADSGLDLNASNMFVRDRVKSYAEVADSPMLAARVAKRDSGGQTNDELAANVDATVPTDTSLINVSVSADSARGAARQANAVADELIRFVQKLEKPAGDGASPVQLSVVRKAEVPSTTAVPRVPLDYLIGGFIGLLLGLGLAVAQGARSMSAKDETTDEDETEEPVEEPEPVDEPVDEPTAEPTAETDTDTDDERTDESADDTTRLVGTSPGARD